MQAVIPGVIPGTTETLPVGSSAHLAIIPALAPGLRQSGVALDVLLNPGTLLAVPFFRRREGDGFPASPAPGDRGFKA